MDKYQFGNKLTEYRMNKGLTQSELGEILGVSNKAVSKWENGSAMPRLDMMSKITDYFGVSMDEFLGIESGKESTDEELEQKYLKLYNEKMARQRLIHSLLFVILPSLIAISVLVYIFGPVIIVRAKYSSLPDYAKNKPEQFENYDSSFSDEFDNGELIEICLSGEVNVTLPQGCELVNERSDYEKTYKTIESGEDKSDLYKVFYMPYEDDLEPVSSLLSIDGWFAENYGRELNSMYDIWWLYYNYDFTDVKLGDWKEAIMSVNILKIYSFSAMSNDKLIIYEGEFARGFITEKKLEDIDNVIYIADLYNEAGDKITVTFMDKNQKNIYDYEMFCKIINSVRFADSEEAVN